LRSEVIRVIHNHHPFLAQSRRLAVSRCIRSGNLRNSEQKNNET
jgi:hypothetical protein